MHRRTLPILLIAALPGACDRGAPAATHPPARASDTAPYDTALPMGELMGHAMQFAADGIWKWQGVVLDQAGEHQLAPKNAEDWEEAESGALALAELTNVLLVPGRRIDDPAWDRSVARVRALAQQAAAAAERHDNRAFLAAGDRLDGACDECHARFDPRFGRQ